MNRIALFLTTTALAMLPAATALAHYLPHAR